MTAVWTAIGAVALLNYLTKAIGPLALAGRRVPAGVERVIGLLGPALLAGLVVVDAVAGAGRIVLDARVAGVAAAAGAIALRAPLVIVVAVAPVATAVARLLGWG